MREEILGLVKRVSGQENILVLPRLFVDLTGDHHSALLLSQLLYWSDRSANREGWVYKSHADWQGELGLNRYYLDKAKKRLRELGFIEVKVKKANGNPTMHFKVDEVVVRGALTRLPGKVAGEGDKSKSERAAEGNAEAGQKEMPGCDITLTKTTTESTTESGGEGGGASVYERELFDILERIPRFPGGRPLEKLRELESDYPKLDYRLEFKKFAEYWSTRQVKRPWLALRNWLERAGERRCQRSGAKPHNRSRGSRELPASYTAPPRYDD